MKGLQTTTRKEVRQMSDDALYRLLHETPDQGIRALIQQYGGYVAAIVRGKLTGTGTREDIEEAVSDVFVMFWERCKSHPDESANIRAMLAVMAKRHAVSCYHKLRRQPVCDNTEELLCTLPQDAPAPDESVILAESVKALGEPDSEIILRRYYFGQSSKEIGAALGLLPNTVDQKISRGLKKLRAVWKEETL
jgi:RNA polymerase sigma-70 factor (ECF subfamily)